VRIALAQTNPTVGDVTGNTDTILAAWREAAAAGADLVVFTELTVTGYPPEDLLLKPEFVAANLAAVERLRAEGPAGCTAIVGHVAEDATDDDPRPLDEWDVTVSARRLSNAAAVLRDGAVVGTYRKWRLPNYGVFDEARYFLPDDDPLVVDVAGVPVGVTVCEDLWAEAGPVAQAAAAGARVVANLNASPYHRGKRADREGWARHHVSRDGTWLVYVNQVGGQDEVVFDGDSFLMGPDGRVHARTVQFATDLVVVDVDLDAGVAARTAGADADRLDPVAEVWEALVLGVRDYVTKNGFADVHIGLSGGIDSAVTAAVAADALGPDHVTGVAMPSPWSSDHSLADAEALAGHLGIAYDVIPIEPAMDAFAGMLAEQFAGTEPGLAEENLQSRIRGVTLMALSNKHGSLVLTTGNKSEMAVGYATLYGDMAGAFAVLKDVDKLLVYELARYRNTLGPAIPQRTIDKPPSAELRPDQLDTDSLPPYEVLDPILDAYVEDDLSIDRIVADGHDRATVERIVAMVDRAEYKRRQAPPGPKVTDRAFGKDRRVPITNGWRG
jgi:NAD+ synthase (glutamine-hydrolysing)